MHIFVALRGSAGTSREQTSLRSRAGLRKGPKESEMSRPLRARFTRHPRGSLAPDAATERERSRGNPVAGGGGAHGELETVGSLPGRAAVGHRARGLLGERRGLEL